MPFVELHKSYPFPGTLAKFGPPGGPNDWQPKTWGTNAHVAGMIPDFRDPYGRFIDDGVQINDILYVMDSHWHRKHVTYVTGVWNNDFLSVLKVFDEPDDHMIYKIGMKAPHSLQSLARIIKARGLYAFTIHWHTVWTQAPFLDFRHDENGDVYVCYGLPYEP